MSETNIGDITIDITLKDVINTINVLNVATPVIIPAEYDISITKVHIDLTRYWESGTERDTWSNTLTFDHNSYGVGQFTDSWFISSSQ